MSERERPAPDFTPLARQYALSRPGYPAELYAYLAGLVERHDLAWDCATGSGQAALALVDHFDKVIATDVSAGQIEHATSHPRIEYRVAPAEQSGIEEHSVDLVTIAAAIHWFDLDAFGTELERVVRPGGVVAAWTYHIGHMEPPLDEISMRFYREALASYFGGGARLVNERYETIPLPGTSVEAPRFVMSAAWTLEQMRGFIASWSGVQKYIEERGEDPAKLIAADLERVWGDPDRVLELRWPLYFRVSRL